MIVIGDEDAVAVYPPGEEVAVKDVAFPEEVFGENEIDACPLLNALDVPWFVDTTELGVPGAVFGKYHAVSYTSNFDISVL